MGLKNVGEPQIFDAASKNRAAGFSRKPAYICYLARQLFAAEYQSQLMSLSRSVPPSGRGHCALICPHEAPGAVRSPGAG